MNNLTQHIEALIFTSPEALSFDEIKKCLNEFFDTNFKDEILMASIEELKERYKADNFAIEVVEIGGGYAFMTKGAFHESVGVFLKQNNKRRLSKSALETLSIVAYRQPVTKTEVEKIRGVSCDYSIQKLLEKDLVEIYGRSDGPGRPLIYATGAKFMDYFGIKDMSELPKLKEFAENENQVGEKAPIEEMVQNPPGVEG